MSILRSLQTVFVGATVCGIAALSTADSTLVATPVAGMISPSQQGRLPVAAPERIPAVSQSDRLLAPPSEARATAAPSSQARPVAKKRARAKAALKPVSKPPVKLAALGTPDIGFAALPSMTEEQALKSLEQEVSLKVGKHIVDSDYPDDARRWRWTGTTMIEVLVGTDGLVKDVLLSRSSGFRVLDESALSVVKRVSKLYVPFRLRGREHSVTVPIGFYLKDI